jgi:hypothetical protein
MKDVLYQMIGTSPAPQGGGDTRSWFFYYKIPPTGEDEEVYVPATRDAAAAYAGDRLWFVMDDKIVAVVPISHIEHDPINDQREFWYTGKYLLELDIPFDDHARGRILNGEMWKEISRRSKPSKLPVGI